MEVFHGRHAAVGRLIVVGVPLGRTQSPEPPVLEVVDIGIVGLVVIGHGRSQLVGVALEDAVYVHEGVHHLAVLAHPPHLGSASALLPAAGCPSQELLEALAHQRAAHIEDEVGHEVLDIVGRHVSPHHGHLYLSFLQPCEHFLETACQEVAGVVVRGGVLARRAESGGLDERHGPRADVLDAMERGRGIVLSHDDHRPAGVQEVEQVAIVESASVETGPHIVYPVGMGELLLGELVEGFGDVYVDVHGARLAVHAVDDGLVGLSLAIPCLLVVHPGRGRVVYYIRCNHRQVDTPVHHLSEDVGLRKGLPVLLTYPRLGAVGRDDDDGQLLIVGLGDGGIDIEQG